VPTNPPLTSSGRLTPVRASPIPPRVKAAALYLVHGLGPDDETCRTIDMPEAARLAGIPVDQFRRWLSRSQVRAFIRAERKIALEAIAAGNPGALQRVRDRVGGNAMASVAAVKVVEEMLAAENGGHAGDSDSGSGPGITIIIGSASANAPPITIDARPSRTLAAPYVSSPPAEPEPMRERDPIFKP
jgi:hypothetical protein